MADKVVKKRTSSRSVKKTATRKAPTRASSQVSEGRNPIPFIVLGVFLVIIAISIGFGYTDKGQINVEDTINNRKINATTEEERAVLDNIPVQQKRPSAPNGGLVPTKAKDKSTVKPPVQEVASSTATTTDDLATSTEPLAEETNEADDITEEPAPDTDQATTESVTE